MYTNTHRESQVKITIYGGRGIQVFDLVSKSQKKEELEL